MDTDPPAGVGTGRPALRRCVGLEPEVFAGDYWGGTALLSLAPTLPRAFDDLFSLSAVDELLSRRGLRTPFIRMVKRGRVADSKRFTRPGGVGAQVGDQVADDRVMELFADGHTIVLQGLHRLWPPLIEFAGQLRSDLGHPVQVNAYITPVSSQGFSAHYDEHDVFVLQISGAKRWRVHDPIDPDPLPGERWTDHESAVVARADEQPRIDAVLRPGDALYLPRGFLHAAEALGEVSAHLTVGVHPITRHTIVQSLVALVSDDPALRVSLPLGVDVSDPSDLRGDLAATVDTLVARLRAATADDVARHLCAKVVAGNRPAPLAPLSQAAALQALDLDAVLGAREHLAYAVHDEESEVVVVLPDRRLRLPATCSKAARLLLGSGATRLRDLPGLDADEALDLARRLLRAGAVVTRGEPETPTP